MNNTVEIRVFRNSVIDSTILGTLPEGCRPAEPILLPNAYIGTSATSAIQISTNGQVVFQNTGSAVNVRAHCVFYV